MKIQIDGVEVTREELIERIVQDTAKLASMTPEQVRQLPVASWPTAPAKPAGDPCQD